MGTLFEIIKSILQFSDPTLRGIFDKMRIKSPTAYLIFAAVLGAIMYALTYLTDNNVLILNETGKFVVWVVGYVTAILTRPTNFGTMQEAYPRGSLENPVHIKDNSDIVHMTAFDQKRDREVLNMEEKKTLDTVNTNFLGNSNEDIPLWQKMQLNNSI